MEVKHSEMVERVARALCRSRFNDENEWYWLVSEAHAVIEAFRNPPQALIDKFSEFAQPIGFVPEGWDAMVDVALGKL